MKITRLALVLGISVMVLLPPPAAFAVDTVVSRDAPDLTAVRSKIKAKDFEAALAELNGMVDQGVQNADVYNLIGFSQRKTGDYTRALTFYKKALDFDADHKGAHEYLGELYVETGRLAQAREHLAMLERLCPQGCEEREDLAKVIAAAAPRTN